MQPYFNLKRILQKVKKKYIFRSQDRDEFREQIKLRFKQQKRADRNQPQVRL